MLQKIPIIMALAIVLFLTGCVKQSTFVNVNLPIEDIQSSKNTILSTSTNNNVNRADTSNNNINNSATVPTKVAIPVSLELKVAFSSQAPYGNWDEFHKEACEEASMVTVAKYFLNQSLDEKIMDEELYKLDAWEKYNGYKIDLSAQEIADIIKAYFNLQAKVVDDVSVDRIKYELSLGNLVIVPAAGRELNNPYFRTPGPIYHMLVIKGYNSSEFITNEVGSKRGNGFKYKYQALINAVHDWDPSWSHYEVTEEQMSSQLKRMVVVGK